MEIHTRRVVALVRRMSLEKPRAIYLSNDLMCCHIGMNVSRHSVGCFRKEMRSALIAITNGLFKS